jgi:hypothetical protein
MLEAYILARGVKDTTAHAAIHATLDNKALCPVGRHTESEPNQLIVAQEAKRQARRRSSHHVLGYSPAITHPAPSPPAM